MKYRWPLGHARARVGREEEVREVEGEEEMRRGSKEERKKGIVNH